MSIQISDPEKASRAANEAMKYLWNSLISQSSTSQLLDNANETAETKSSMSTMADNGLTIGTRISYFPLGIHGSIKDIKTSTVNDIEVCGNSQFVLYLDNSDVITEESHFIRKLVGSTNQLLHQDWGSLSCFLRHSSNEPIREQKSYERFDGGKGDDGKENQETTEVIDLTLDAGEPEAGDSDSDSIKPETVGCMGSAPQTIASLVRVRGTFIGSDILDKLISKLRVETGADITSTYCLSQMYFHGWPSIAPRFFKFSRQTRQNRQSPKPYVDAEKLIMPYFIGNHWSLIVRFRSLEESPHYWEFLTVDSGRDYGFGHRYQMDSLINSTLLHLAPTDRVMTQRYSSEVCSRDSYKIEVLPTVSQHEFECGARMAFHLYLASIATNKDDFVRLVSCLHGVNGLPQHSRDWLYDAVTQDETALPTWFLESKTRNYHKIQQTLIPQVVGYHQPVIATPSNGHYQPVITSDSEGPVQDAVCNDDVHTVSTTSLPSSQDSVTSRGLTPSAHVSDYPGDNRTTSDEGSIDNTYPETSNDGLPDEEEANNDNVFEEYRLPDGSSRFARFRSKKRKAALISPTEGVFSWAEASKKASILEKTEFIYNGLIKYGRLDTFYEKKLLSSSSFIEWQTKYRTLKKILQRLEGNNKKTSLPIKQRLTPFHTSSIHLTQQEQLFEFEHRMLSLNVHTCPECYEYSLQIDSKKRSNPTHHACQSCRAEKRKKNHFIEENIQPVWFRRNADGSIETDKNNNPILQFHIPPELNNLSMAEKLLIRRVCPYVPLVHLKNGNVGMKGHCICFPQDVTEVCNTLPHERSQVVKYIRQIGKPDQTTPRIEILRVNRDKVLSALRWLKIHHSGYHDITIKSTNLDWIPAGKNEDELETHEFIFGSKSKKDHQNEEVEAVSDAQRINVNHEDYIPSFAVQPNQSKYRPPESEKDNIRSISQSAKSQSHISTLDFPPTDNLSPIR